MTEIRCGQIWFVEGGGDFLRKGRPALVLQNDDATDVDSVTVCLFTSNLDSAAFPLLRVLFSPTTENGLDRASWLMIDKIQSVRRSRMKQLISEADDPQILQALERVTQFLSCQPKSLRLRLRLRRLLRLPP